MLTEINELSPEKLLYKDQDGIIKELCSYEYKEENCNDDSIDAMEYAASRYMEMANKGASITFELPKEKVRRILKLYGLEKITRKRFKKLLMGCGIQRNEAEKIAKIAHENNMKYTPILVQEVIEIILRELENHEKKMCRKVGEE